MSDKPGCIVCGAPVEVYTIVFKGDGEEREVGHIACTATCDPERLEWGHPQA